MAVPASGTIAILATPNGSCSSLSAVSCGSVVAPKSLSALATAVGKSLPINMTTCWYGYNNSIKITPASFLTIPAAGCTAVVTICAPAFNAGPAYCGANTWLHPQGPLYCTSPTGVAQNIVVDANAGVARSGCACYLAAWGPSCCITICQAAASKVITLTCICTSSCGGNSANAKMCFTVTPAMLAAECFNITIHGSVGTMSQAANSFACIAVVCSTSTCCYNCVIGPGLCCTNPTYTFNITGAYRCCWSLCVSAYATNTTCIDCSDAYANIFSVTGVVGSFCVGSPISCDMYTG